MKKNSIIYTLTPLLGINTIKDTINSDLVYKNMFNNLIEKIEEVGGYSIKTQEPYEITRYLMKSYNLPNAPYSMEFLNKINFGDVLMKHYGLNTLVGFGSGVVSAVFGVVNAIRMKKDKELKMDNLGVALGGAGVLNSILEGVLYFGNPIKVEGENVYSYIMNHPEWVNEFSRVAVNLLSAGIIGAGVAGCVGVGLGVYNKIRNKRVVDVNYKNLAEVVERVK